MLAMNSGNIFPVRRKSISIPIDLYMPPWGHQPDPPSAGFLLSLGRGGEHFEKKTVRKEHKVMPPWGHWQIGGTEFLTNEAMKFQTHFWVLAHRSLASVQDKRLFTDAPMGARNVEESNWAEMKCSEVAMGNSG